MSTVSTATAWENPLRDPRDRRLPRIAGPSGLVIFGVTGDLSRKKLMPAVYDLANRGLLPPGFSLVGFARRDWEDQDFAQVVHDAVREHARTPFREEVWQQLAEGMRFIPGDFDDDTAFKQLRNAVEELDSSRGTGGNFAFYLSVPPKFFPKVVEQLKKHGLANAPDGAWRRAVIEKPFGHDLASARELNAIVHDVFEPDQVFRIDHYLGKETVQNILALRFANQMFEPIWNRSYRRPRPDHDGRGHRHRRPRRLLRRHRRGAGRHPEPSAPADGADRDGGARLLRRGLAAHREAEGPQAP
ncbi:Glucose-6-phosphate 1-dehydrogenase [Streptomyces aurantiogriseus]